MKRLLIIFLILMFSLITSAYGTPAIEFSPNPDNAGSWYYDGAGTLSFDQVISVDKAMSSNYDSLVGSLVYIPTFNVAYSSDSTYKLSPLGSSKIAITNSDGSATYLTGSLNTGDLYTIGTIGAAYSQFQSDIVDVQITQAGLELGSAALTAIAKSGTMSLDFELALLGGSGTNYLTFEQMLEGGYAGGNGFSGAMSIPEPMTIILLSAGSLVMLKRKRGA